MMHIFSITFHYVGGQVDGLVVHSINSADDNTIGLSASEKLKRFFVCAAILYPCQSVDSYEHTARVSGVRFSR